MVNIIPYIKKQEKELEDKRIPLYINSEISKEYNKVDQSNKNSTKKNNDIDTNVDFTIRSFDIKF